MRKDRKKKGVNFMKKFLTAALIVTLAGSSAGVASFAADQPERGYISVNTSANTEVSPDVVEISISVKTEDSKSMIKATTQNKEISDKVYAALKSMINSANGDYVKTADYNAAPIYTYNSNGKRNFDKYEVSNNIIVHTKNIDKTGNIIDKAISLGATDVNDLVFSISNYEAQCNDLLEIAAKKAKTRADLIAKSSSSYITGIKSMNLSCSTNENNRVQYRLYAKNMSVADSSAGAAPEAAATPIQGGIIKIYANLNASYFVK